MDALANSNGDTVPYQLTVSLFPPSRVFTRFTSPIQGRGRRRRRELRESCRPTDEFCADLLEFDGMRRRLITYRSPAPKCTSP